jgi:tetratricopeptide (TPR) repeat protein
MKLTPVVLLFALSGLAALAQTTNAPAPAVAPAPKPTVIDVPQPPQPDQQNQTGQGPTPSTTDPAKIAELQSRFAQGQALEQAGKLTEALAVFDGIIADAPDAKGSLREAGLITFRQGDLTRADGYFEKLHQLVPDYPMAIESLIQINQALKRDVKVAILNKEFHELRAAGKVPNPYFVRERVDLGLGDQLVMTEFFDYAQEPNTVWMGEVFDSTGARKRWFLLNYEPDATKALRAKNAQLAQANAEVFNLYEYVLKDDKPVEVDVYKNYVGLPDYRKTRLDILAILATPTKPIYSEAVPPSAQ